MEKNNSKIHFYTQNGWCGSNYDQTLTTKEIAVKVRAFLKKECPSFKFSVRSKWGSCSDSLYITILSGPIPALVEGNPHSYESSISGFGDAYKGRITNEMLQVCDKIHAFVSSFRFSDSDGMQDYFDTNFYCWTYIGDYERPYQQIEPKTPAIPVEAVPVSEVAEIAEPLQTIESLEVVDYSEKAIALFGNTKDIKEQLKELGGRFNPSLKYNGGKRAGWIFSKKQADKVRALLAPSVDAEQEDNAPTSVAYGDSEISQKKGYYTKEVDGMKVEAYLAKKSDLDELLDSAEAHAVREMIEKKERAILDACENIGYYTQVNNPEFAATEQARADLLGRQLSQLKDQLKRLEPEGAKSDPERDKRKPEAA